MRYDVLSRIEASRYSFRLHGKEKLRPPFCFEKQSRKKYDLGSSASRAEFFDRDRPTEALVKFGRKEGFEGNF